MKASAASNGVPSNGRQESTQATATKDRKGHLVALHEKLDKKKALIGVVGLGYVGLPLAVEYAREGFQTLGIDLDAARVEKLSAGINYMDDISDESVADVVSDGKFEATTSFDRYHEVDVFYVCVPTPVTEHKEPETGYIEAATRSIAEHLRPGQLVILKSTTYPGTTENLVQPILEEAAAEKDMLLGRDYFLAFSPERIDPGNKQFTTSNTPVVVGGVTKACTDLAELAMGQIIAQVHTVSSPSVGEMEKLLENIFRSVNIALVNEMARLCDRIGGISVWEVVEAAASKPFGFMPFYPGPGLGGHCIPIDPYYMSWVARQHDFETSFITLSARVNEEMPFYVIDGVVRSIAEQPIRMADAKVLILGVAFKRDVDDTRHSPAGKVIELLREKGVEHIQYADPHVPEYEAVAFNGGTETLEAQPLTDELLRAHDVVVIMTDHSAFPYSSIAEESKAIVDTRNALEHVPHNREKVMLLGGGNF